jgi:hypothetical protein
MSTSGSDGGGGGMGLVRAIKVASAWASFVVGGVGNLLVVWLVLRHTPKTMQIYSKILLQTALTDLTLIVLTVLSDSVSPYMEYFGNFKIIFYFK